ncbi:8004_t:CDS:2, partial [Racocetra persica]
YNHANVDADVNIATDVYNHANVDVNAGVNIDANVDINVKVNANVNEATDIYNQEFFDTFLKTMKDDYEHCGPQLRAALEKLAERYNAAKAKSIP